MILKCCLLQSPQNCQIITTWELLSLLTQAKSSHERHLSIFVIRYEEFSLCQLIAVSFLVTNFFMSPCEFIMKPFFLEETYLFDVIIENSSQLQFFIEINVAMALFRRWWLKGVHVHLASEKFLFNEWMIIIIFTAQSFLIASDKSGKFSLLCVSCSRRGLKRKIKKLFTNFLFGDSL